MITLQSLNKAEAVRYLGGAGVAPNDAMNALLDDCERELLSVIDAKYLFRIIDLPCAEMLQGQDIQRHLAGCRRAIVLCATLGAGVYRLSEPPGMIYKAKNADNELRIYNNTNNIIRYIIPRIILII